jgi:hypothetical protein
LRDAAIADLGLVALPTFIVSEAVQRGALKPVLCDFELDDPSIHAVWPPNRALSAKVRAFVDFLSDRFGGTPYWDAALAAALESASTSARAAPYTKVEGAWACARAEVWH